MKPHPFNHFFLRRIAAPAPAALCALLLLGSLSPLAGQQVTLDRLQLVGTTDITLEFSDDGTGVLADFGVEATSDLQTWLPVGDAVLESLGNGRWRATVPFDQGAPRRFFRVTKNGEAITGTFSSTTSTIREGEAGGVEVVFSAPYTGVVNYTVNFGDGSPSQSGSVNVQGASSAILPITVPDDGESGTLRNLSLNLDGGDFALGLLTSTNLTVEDNDSEWAGVLIGDDDGITTQINLKITATGGAPTAALVAESGTVFPDKPGGWAASISVDETALAGSVTGITIPGEETLYGQDTILTLTFNPGGGGEVLKSPVDGAVRGYEGSYTLSSSVPALQHLNIPDRTGTFLIYRKPALAPAAKPTEPIN